MSDAPISPESWAAALDVLRKVAANPEVALDLPALERAVQPIAKQARRRRRAAGEPTEDELARREAQSQTDRRERGAHDEALIRSTELHQIHHGGANSGESPSASSAENAGAAKGAGTANSLNVGVLQKKPRDCHICSRSYREVDAFYHRLCPECAAENRTRREQRVDLAGRIALVTGGRVKIGHATALRLLRNGARVIVTTRFPHEAAHRFSKAPDFEAWRERLQIYALDLLDLRGVLDFGERLAVELPALDILINNAAQTVKRPPSFYAPAMAYESEQGNLLLPSAQALVASTSFVTMGDASVSHSNATASAAALRIWTGKLDRHGQPEDLRDANSWTLRSHEVPPAELLEALVVNAAAPSILTAQLRPLLLRSPHRARFIVNATGLDGRFDTPGKTSRHAHVNMSKAALNMLTRTAAEDYAQDGIYMNSVDTGWISDEAGFSAREQRRQSGWAPPLDEVDAAARLCAPLFDGIQGSPASGLLYRHYHPSAW